MPGLLFLCVANSSRSRWPRTPPMRTAPRRSRQPRDGEERTRIFVVDDDLHTLRYVRDTLAEADYAPVVTGDPEALPGLIRTHKQRLVLPGLVFAGHRRHQVDGEPARTRGPAGHLLPHRRVSNSGTDGGRESHASASRMTVGCTSCCPWSSSPHMFSLLARLFTGQRPGANDPVGDARRQPFAGWRTGRRLSTDLRRRGSGGAGHACFRLLRHALPPPALLLRVVSWTSTSLSRPDAGA